MPVELYSFQKQGVRRLEQLGGRALLCDEMGTGKSVQYLMYLHRNRPERLPAVVACPASLKFNWRAEAAMHLGMRSEILDGLSPPSRQRFSNTTSLVIVNYDILHAWLPYLESLGIKSVGLDEAHYLCNPEARRTIAAKTLCEGKRSVVAITGTPLTNRPIELWTIMNIVRPEVFPSRFLYGQEFCGAEPDNHGGWSYRGATNLQKLHETIKPYMIRRLKAEVLPQLPSKTRRVVLLPINNAAEYRKAEKDYLNWLREKHGNAKAWRAAKSDRMTRMGYQLRLAAEGKLPAVLEWTDSFLQGCNEKLILFAIHKAFIGELKKRFKDACVVVDGSVRGRDRERAFEQFKKTRRTRLLIGNVQAAGVGWNGTVARDVALAELPWRPGDTTQAEDRSHRIGQEFDVNCHWLVAHGTIEHSMCRVLQKKQRDITAVLDGGAGEDLPVMDLLEQEMLRARGAILV